MSTFEKKIENLKADFAPLTIEEKYKQIIEFGLKHTSLPVSSFSEDEIVEGCQSKLYLKTSFKDGLVFFQTFSDALISKGLALLLTTTYSGETPELVIKQKPQFLLDLGIYEALSPSRSNGVQSLFLKMQKACVKYLI
ncbi:MAG: Sulfur acceptor protein CsdE [Chlamydiia bacterium]|nr:Sulfur acceptor protein CsdE [Chlamydiia bacterium]MCH9615357.1 Sulfur acceptor protein CsdE [Chlamydiia bacterium]MCH9628321.1 Sulfur acceptor protein CsdE [Chlamydiia bacterium]